MASFPAHPRYARMLLAAQELGCVRAAALIAALSQSRNILLKSEGKRMDETREDILGGGGESRILHPSCARGVLRRAGNSIRNAAALSAFTLEARAKWPGRSTSCSAFRSAPELDVAEKSARLTC